jgi:hypothetical protein
VLFFLLKVSRFSRIKIFVLMPIFRILSGPKKVKVPAMSTGVHRQERNTAPASHWINSFSETALQNGKMSGRNKIIIFGLLRLKF